MTPLDTYGELRLRRLCELLIAGLFLSEACRACRMDEGKVRRWLSKGDGGHEQYADFAVMVREAEASLVETALREIKSDWRGYQWLLERRFPTRWGPKAADSYDDGMTELEDLKATLKERLEAVLVKAAADS